VWSYYDQLNLPVEGYLIYLEYWFKAIGRWVKKGGTDLHKNLRGGNKTVLEMFKPVFEWHIANFVQVGDKTAGIRVILYLVLSFVVAIATILKLYKTKV
jgi:hypothetical protein